MRQSPEREAFLRAALRSLRPGRARDALERELRGHMDDAAEAYRAQGLPPEEAEARAVASMGDPKALARQIRQAHRPAVPAGALALLAALGAASAVLQTASRGPGALASRLLALALGGALGAAALCLDARRAARWAAPLLGGLVAAFLAAAALTPRISGGYPPVDALAALLAPGLGLLAGRLRLRRGGAILLGAAALGAMALCAALGSRAGALLSAAALAGAALELGRRGAWRAGRGAAWAVAAALVLGGALAAVLLYANGSAPAQELLYVKNSVRALLEGDLSAGVKMARSGDYLLARLTGQWGGWAWPALLALPLALGLRLCRTARRAPDPEGAAVAAACAAALLARTVAYALANLGWTATEPNLPVLLRTDLGCAADLAAACAGLAADARLRPLRRAGKGGMLFPCAGLRRAGRRERA